MPPPGRSRRQPVVVLVSRVPTVSTFKCIGEHDVKTQNSRAGLIGEGHEFARSWLESCAWLLMVSLTCVLVRGSGTTNSCIALCVRANESVSYRQLDSWARGRDAFQEVADEAKMFGLSYGRRLRQLAAIAATRAAGEPQVAGLSHARAWLQHPWATAACSSRGPPAH